LIDMPCTSFSKEELVTLEAKIREVGEVDILMK
jgi:hypothetical protein